MTEIKLPGHYALVPNEIYRSRINPVTNPALEETAWTQLTTLRRFRVPTQEEVIDFIVSNAADIDVSSLTKDNQFSKDDPALVCCLKSLYESEILKIAGRNRHIIKQLKYHYENIRKREPGNYLQASSVSVADFILDPLLESAGEKDGISYREAIKYAKTQGVDKWRLRMKLSQDWRFPCTQDLSDLLDKKVRDCVLFSVEASKGYTPKYPDIARQIRLFCNNVKHPEILKLINTSGKFLETSCVSTINELSECALVESLNDYGIGETKEDADERETPEEKRIRKRFNGFSDN